MRIVLPLLMLILISNVYAYSVSQDNLNMSIYIANAGKVILDNNINLTIVAHSPSVFKEFNITIPVFPIYTRVTTSTSTTTVPQGGGGVAGGLIVCPENSHYIGNSSCACDSGYAFAEDRETCILNIQEATVKVVTHKGFIIAAITIILTGIIFFMFISKDEEERERIKQRIRDKKREMQDKGVKDTIKDDTKKLMDKAKDKLE